MPRYFLASDTTSSPSGPLGAVLPGPRSAAATSVVDPVAADRAWAKSVPPALVVEPAEVVDVVAGAPGGAPGRGGGGSRDSWRRGTPPPGGPARPPPPPRP